MHSDDTSKNPVFQVLNIDRLVILGAVTLAIVLPIVLGLAETV